MEYRLINFEKEFEELSILYKNSWCKTYIGLLPEELLESFTYDKSKEKWIHFYNNEKNSFIYVAIDKTGGNEVICGFAACKPDDEEQSRGFLYSIHIKSEYKGKGIGKNLIMKSAKHFRDQLGLTSISLRVVVGNDNAYNVYTKLGAEILKHQKMNYYKNVITPEVCLVWNDINQLLLKSN
ncbi:hypothetical protein DICPUDRAFT_158276 [Dictyostelium purpureum]|uniref:N-acetyltransferase domain-containing protein n=1 Tax=Dictyostelium purpureum TaxID=5786 RepID=F1A187_DICPU|nr:uncharacterized protein DICPUDRAFT_158276 [Dictyostelium purpureum]EGC30048.1 hypothetical protein DICPUDRAFT_158276 [Dictyostelium purpureum]|eukprot:XP_003293435.1 hypothetical protein DICPUDRAFT_158276 [Dictyostelium purpureum]